MQQTLLTAHANRAEFRGSTLDEFRSWLRTILRRKVIDEARKLPRRPSTPGVGFCRGTDDSSGRFEGWVAPDGPSPLEEMVRDERDLHLATAMARLPEDQRSVLEARYLLGLSPPEIAEVTNRTRPAVAGLLRRGLIALRSTLGESSGMRFG